MFRDCLIALAILVVGLSPGALGVENPDDQEAIRSKTKSRGQLNRELMYLRTIFDSVSSREEQVLKSGEIKVVAAIRRANCVLPYFLIDQQILSFRPDRAVGFELTDDENERLRCTWIVEREGTSGLIHFDRATMKTVTLWDIKNGGAMVDKLFDITHEVVKVSSLSIENNTTHGNVGAIIVTEGDVTRTLLCYPTLPWENSGGPNRDKWIEFRAGIKAFTDKLNTP